MQSRTIRDCDIKDIINHCFETRDVKADNIDGYEDNLKESDEKLLVQLIAEASDGDEKIASTALVSLEQIGREMRIYESPELLRFLRKSLNDLTRSSYFDYYLDLIKRLLYQSTNEQDDNFLNYAKKYLRKRIIECATSLDIRFDRCRTNAMQIIDNYDMMTPNNRTRLYIQTLMEFVKHCQDDDSRYSRHLNYLTSRLTNNISNRVIIRKKLIDLKKKSSSSETIKRRCDDLLCEYK
jgi:hypothetical protein